jgi:hypothetical protein
MTHKENLYALVDDFVNNRLYIEQFCSLFSDIYHHQIDRNCLSSEENLLFGALARVAHGYTDNEVDLRMLPQYYFSDKQVVEKIDEVRRALCYICPTNVHVSANGESEL